MAEQEAQNPGANEMAAPPNNADVDKYQRKIIFLERRNKAYELHLKKIKKQLKSVLDKIQNKQKINSISETILAEGDVDCSATGNKENTHLSAGTPTRTLPNDTTSSSEIKNEGLVKGANRLSLT